MVLVRRSAQQTFQTTQFPLLLFDLCQYLRSYNKKAEKICMGFSHSKQGGHVALLYTQLTGLWFHNGKSFREKMSECITFSINNPHCSYISASFVSEQ